MADSIIMRWPGTGKQVRLHKIDRNQQIFDWFVEQLPVRAVQSHTVVSGWCMSIVSVPIKSGWDWAPGNEFKEDMSLVPDGWMKIQGQPAGNMVTLLIKYGVRTENVMDMCFCAAGAEDLDTLREAGAHQWKATIQTGEVIWVEWVKADEG